MQAKLIGPWIVAALAPLLGACILVFAVIALGRGTRAALHERESFTLSFADLDCDPPEGLTRPEFLAEVRRRTRQPKHLHLLDASLTTRLARAFAAHPSVESVADIQMSKSPSARSRSRASIRVELVPRQAVLAVRLPGDKVPRDGSALIETWSAKGRNAQMTAWTVDRNGVLLPGGALRSHLPVLTAEIAAPDGPPGTQWGDERVSAAAAVVAYLRPYLSRLRLDDCDVEIDRGEVVFRKPGVRVVWGHPPGREGPDEAPAKIKLQRLLAYHSGHDGLESLEHDVRLLAYQGHFPLTSFVRR